MSAILSSCRKFRYRLTRDVNKSGKVTIAYFGINPSTADEKKDDPTVRRWRGFTERNNGVKFIIGNVFAFRATDVGELARAEDPVGPENMLHIDGIISEADILVPCWGSRNKLPRELWGHLDMFVDKLNCSGKPVKCFGKTVSNDPKHPLMLSYDTPFIPY